MKVLKKFLMTSLKIIREIGNEFNNKAEKKLSLNSAENFLKQLIIL